MFGPWIETYVWFKGLLPSFSSGIRWPHFNFITIHYCYLILLSIITSVILYPIGNLEYIDCLFFGSGAATQSGLNTVDLNKLYLYQQIALYLVTCIATPIFINTFVVFVRLYWFEKRFQNVVLEAQRYRRTRERTRSMGQPPNEHDTDMEEKGVAGRKIVVMHPGDRTIERAEKDPTHGTGKWKTNDESNDASSVSSVGSRQRIRGSVHPESSSQSASDEHIGFVDAPTNPPPQQRREIAFADEVPQAPGHTDSDDDAPLPEPRSEEHHIAFVEKQRNPKDTGTLYIPGPRDFDKGYRPREVEDRQTAHADTPITPATRRYLDSEEVFQKSGNPQSTRRRIVEDAAGAMGRAGKGVRNLLKFPDQNTERISEEEEKEEEQDQPNGDASQPNGAASLRRRGRIQTFASFVSNRSNPEDVNPMPYLSYQPTVGRNSAFVNLDENQREELGGIEYRALKTLAITLCTYYLGFHLLGVICLLPWIKLSGSWGPTVDADGISRTWWGFWTSASLFNDLGFTLTPDSFISFKRAVWPLLIGSYLIIIGNTAFPCMLRFAIWVTSLFVPKKSSIWEEFRFLLDHPRRCFTLLFPSKATWWLFWVLVIMNGLDLVFFIVLDLNDPVITNLPAGIRVLDGIFQAASTRTAGFAVVDLAELHPAIQVSYLVMMYISVFPIAISVRRTNVYEERSLGLYGADDENQDETPNQSYVGQHLRRQLSFDLWYVFLGVFIIAIVEGDRLQDPKEGAFNIFAVLFEVVSAYGTVGLSLGYPGTNTSFSGQFRVISKLVIIAMQVRGRHRGLPYALDKAILLPSEEQQRKENADATRRAQRRNSMLSMNQEDTVEDDNSPGPGALNRTQTGRSGRSTQSGRHGRWKNLISAAMSTGPPIKRNE